MYPPIRRFAASTEKDSTKISEKRFFSKGIILIGLIVVIGFVLRIIVASAQSWQADEIFNINYLGDWFTQNFFSYFFQFFHNTFPPRSPVFGNPPLGAWILSIGILVSKLFGWTELFGARFINVIFGTANLVLTYLIGKKLFNKDVGVIAAALLAITPIVIAMDATAYLDTILTFFILFGIYVMLLFTEQGQRKYLLFSGILFGLAILTKFYAAAIFALLVIWLIYFIFAKKNSDARYFQNNDHQNTITLLTFIVPTILTPIILWSGLRDPTHISKMLGFIFSLGNSSGGMFSDFSALGIKTTLLYYPLMLIGRIPPLISIAFIGSIILFFWELKKLFFKSKYSYSEIEYSLEKNFILLVLIFAGLIIAFFAGIPATVHRLAYLLPFVIIFSTAGIFYIIKKISVRYALSTILITRTFMLLFILITGLSLFEYSAQYYNAYNNILVGGINGATNYYRVGDGEGLDVAANWLNQNTPKNAIIGVLRFGPIMEKYTSRKIKEVGLDSNIETIENRGINYLVAHISHDSGPVHPVFLKNGGENRLKLVEKVTVNGAQYIKLYEVTKNAEKMLADNNKSKIYFELDDVSEIDPNFVNLLQVFINTKTPVALAVEPGKITPEFIAYVKSINQSHPNLITIIQHGWKHTNHDNNKDQSEYPATRSYDEQFSEIKQGNDILDGNFGAAYLKVFVPPWGAYSDDTLRVLNDLGYTAMVTGPRSQKEIEKILNMKFQSIIICASYDKNGIIIETLPNNCVDNYKMWGIVEHPWAVKTTEQLTQVKDAIKFFKQQPGIKVTGIGDVIEKN